MSNHTVFLALVAPRSANPNVNSPGRCIGIFRCPVTARCVVDAFLATNPGHDGWTDELVR